MSSGFDGSHPTTFIFSESSFRVTGDKVGVAFGGPVVPLVPF
jgi:hypothetical protein